MAQVSEALATAVKHHQAGCLQAAAGIYRQVLASDPNQADALHLLGVIAAQSGRHAMAVDHIRRAIALKGNAAVFFSNLAGAYRALRRFPEAVACYRRAVELEPDSAEAYNYLAGALKQQGNLTEAVANYRRAVELKPGYAEAHHNLAIALKQQGNLDEAAACFRRAVELRPNYFEAASHLAMVSREQGKLEEAAACCRRAMDLKPNDAEAHNNLAITLRDQGKTAEAITHFRRALELAPGYVEAHYNLGSTFEEMGDFSAAEGSFRAALRHNPRFTFAHCKLAELLRARLPETDKAEQRRLLDDPALAGGQRMLLHFGLAQVLDAQGAYAEAAGHMDRAHALRLSEMRAAGNEYDPRAFEAFVARMIATCTPDFFRRADGFGIQSEAPVFVVGLPRSGTTLIEQILASHSRVFGAGEVRLVCDTLSAFAGPQADFIDGLCCLDRETACRAASSHLERLRTLDGSALRIVDKMPDNYLFLGALAVLFPRAKFIHCRRDLRDVAVSCWMTNFPEIRWTSDRRHMAARFQQYRRIMSHWRNVLPAPMLEVDYEETIADLEQVARRLVAWCGLDWEPGCLDFHQAKRPVKTASAVQVRRPLFGTSVGRWNHYEQGLAPLLEAISAVG
jgi:tetratricopeptide (TPR) repeat protein